ncbi:tetratricopeptide repeat protein, partial [Actinoplanes sp. NPDC026670]|uniref:tetratricopeptide repeat protein n=1 Tax=Actinoplanes sp. NPDC026670 TaxID=3154700 RepID=UPI003408A3EB
MSDALINSLVAAVEARPDDLTLRLHLAELLVAAGRGPEAIGHAAQILAREPGHASAQQLMARALGGGAPAGGAAGGGAPAEGAAGGGAPAGGAA